MSTEETSGSAVQHAAAIIGMEVPKPVFLGFLLKERWNLPCDGPGVWPNSKGEAIQEICTAGECQNKRPEGWIDRWDSNSASCWNSEEAAEKCLANGRREDYALYAYRAIPLAFGLEESVEAVAPDELFGDGRSDLPAEPDLSRFEFLGYDVTEYTDSLSCGCSPLSCNGEHNLYPVNQYCLIGDLPTALQAAVKFGSEEPEPGPYIIIEVLRRSDERSVSRMRSANG